MCSCKDPCWLPDSLFWGECPTFTTACGLALRSPAINWGLPHLPHLQIPMFNPLLSVKPIREQRSRVRRITVPCQLCQISRHLQPQPSVYDASQKENGQPIQARASTLEIKTLLSTIRLSTNLIRKSSFLAAAPIPEESMASEGPGRAAGRDDYIHTFF